jgi:hypothetical protein
VDTHPVTEDDRDAEDGGFEVTDTEREADRDLAIQVATAALRDKRRALGRALAAGVMGDDARIDEEMLFMRAVDDLDEMHLRLLGRARLLSDSQVYAGLAGWTPTQCHARRAYLRSPGNPARARNPGGRLDSGTSRLNSPKRDDTKREHQ